MSVISIVAAPLTPQHLSRSSLRINNNNSQDRWCIILANARIDTVANAGLYNMLSDWCADFIANVDPLGPFPR